MSFGAWVATAVGAADPRVTLLLAIAPAVDHYDYAGLRISTKPTFVIHGEADEVASIRQVRRLYGDMIEPKELIVIAGADHVFDGQASLVGEAIEDLLGDFDVTGEHEGHEDNKEERVRGRHGSDRGAP